YQGRREDVAASLFVHPQTVRYRMGQLRELYGDRLDDPSLVLAASIALATMTPEKR
ncbi:MAG: helix-turn-helix domain-containing protein, partial [Actinomycetota bacterium]|nr:helix-turn-helix domain-containing protein [Actinomycetota bacterium]